ncbi:MAG TPA: hypothetical protein PL029_06505, partial [Bacteroidia bacterium]|nr:hypothetical protein [Bacteroidia bacterium]
MFSKIIVSSEWYYFFLSVITGLGISLLLYYRNKKNKEVSRTTLLWMSLLRFTSVALITFFLLDIFFKTRRNETQNPVLLLAIDNSSSMTSGSDSTFVKKELLAALSNFKNNLASKFTVKTVLFGDKTSADQYPDFSEKETDLENLVKDLDNNYSGQNNGALVIVSDGIYNKGASPVYAAEKLGYPVFSLAMGDTSQIRDVMIRKINHNQVAYLGNNFPVEVLVNVKKYQGEEVTVTLNNNGVEKARQIIKVSSPDFLSTCNFTLNAATTGLVKYTARVNVLEGEKNTANNNLSFVMEVIDNREKVLLLANTPHPDVSAIKDAIVNSTSFELEYAMAADFKKPLQPYSLVIFHGFSPNQFQLLNECKNGMVPYWIVNPVTVENLPGVKIGGGFSRSSDAEPFLDQSFGLFTLSNELKSLLKDLPAVTAPFGNYNVANNASNLISQRIGVVETENPLLLFTEINGLKTGVFVGDGLWKWKLRDFAEHNNNALFQELISKCVQYLSVKSDKSFFRISAPKIINENENIELGAEVYNKSYELVTEPDVTLVLSDARDKKFNYTFSKTAGAYQLNVGLLAPGEYRYTAMVKTNGDTYLKQGIIVVKEVVAEKINTVANHVLLYQMANRTNGKVYYPAQLKTLEEDL